VTDELSYEEARDQLIEVVRTLEQGGTSLAESLALNPELLTFSAWLAKYKSKIPLA